MWFESLLVFILFKFKKRPTPNISGIRFLFVCLSICIFVRLSVVRPSIHPSIYLSIYLSIYHTAIVFVINVGIHVFMLYKIVKIILLI